MVSMQVNLLKSQVIKYGARSPSFVLANTKEHQYQQRCLPNIYQVFFFSVVGIIKCSVLTCNIVSLADAEMSEDVAENFVCGDFSAGDFGKMKERLSKILGNEVAADAQGEG